MSEPLASGYENLDPSILIARLHSMGLTAHAKHGPEISALVGAEDIRTAVGRVLQSRGFRHSERLQRLLKFAVECALQGTVDQLKESVLGRVVFDRGSKYDPRTDSIVRVESVRLRKRLREYYDGEGRNDPVSIILQPGSYVPTFRHVAEAPADSRETQGKLLEQPLPRPSTVAVLPLSNLCTDPDQEYLCDGITDEIIYALSCIRGLTVIGHTSVFALKDALLDAREIGFRLGAGTVVGGSVRKAGSRVKIFAEVLDAASGEVRWAETFDRTIDEIFSVEEEIAQAVTRVLQVTLAPHFSPWLTRGAPDMNAYLLYLQGRHEWNRMTATGYSSAVAIFERAISSYPTYAPPFAGLADAYSYLAFWGYARPHDVFPKAQHAALRALALDSSLPHANCALAAVKLFYEWKWDEAVDLAGRATELEPSHAFGHQIYGCCLLARGEMKQASRCFERAVTLDPLSVTAHRLLGWALHLQRRPSDAEKWLQAALVLDRESLHTHYLLAHVYLSEGRFETALEQARQCQTHPPNPLGAGVLGACLARLNRRDEARAVLSELAQLSEAGYIDPYTIGQVHIALNDLDRAIESVERVLDERAPFAFSLKLDPGLDPLRPDPRFAELVARLGI